MTVWLGIRNTPPMKPETNILTADTDDWEEARNEVIALRLTAKTVLALVPTPGLALIEPKTGEEVA